MINFFDQPVKNDLRTHDNVRKVATGLGDYYTIGCDCIIGSIMIVSKIIIS